MEKTHYVPFNFAALGGISAAWDSAAVVVLPVPYDLTTSFLSGSREGPYAVIKASAHLELFDQDLLCDISRCGIHTRAMLEQTTNGPADMIGHVCDAVAEILSHEKTPVMIGGEHSITLGAVRALHSFYDSFGVVQFDAHADMRDSYQGSPFNHACTARRISESTDIVQLGIRSMSEEEHQLLRNRSASYFSSREIIKNVACITESIDELPQNIYITFDLDALDPSIMPSVGTPEPGGLDWYTTLDCLDSIAGKKNIIGFDIVELCPQPSNAAPDFLAAKLCYKLIGYCMQSRNRG